MPVFIFYTLCVTHRNRSVIKLISLGINRLLATDHAQKEYEKDTKRNRTLLQDCFAVQKSGRSISKTQDRANCMRKRSFEFFVRNARRNPVFDARRNLVLKARGIPLLEHAQFGWTADFYKALGCRILRKRFYGRWMVATVGHTVVRSSTAGRLKDETTENEESDSKTDRWDLTIDKTEGDACLVQDRRGGDGP